MGAVELTSARTLQIGAIIPLLWLVGCASAPQPQALPDVDTELDVPEADDGTPQLVRGDDGLWYAVGEFDEPPETGDAVFGRYDGKWPLEDTDPPALFAGRVVERHGERIARVHPTWEFPDIDHDELHAQITDDFGDETMGKGIGTVQQVDHGDQTHLTLSIGEQQGVQQGDLYAVLDDSSQPNPNALQLTRRLAGVCMVVEADGDDSQCRLHRGHPDHPGLEQVHDGQRVAFLEPSFGTAPREATIFVSTVDDDIDDWIVEHLQGYVDQFPGAYVTVELFDDEEVDAEDEAFHRWTRRIDTEDEPAVLLGANLESDELVLNYTGLGTAVGPGMVAAPPEGGVSMGPVDELQPDDWRGVASVLMGAVMVYRGQNAEALAHLHQALRDEGLTGKWRWHARDQYAMRWAAVDHYEEAMWLVREDETLGEATGDDQARYNALGTRVRLHDYLDQPQRADDTAERYLEHHEDDRPSTGYLSAAAMYAEMAVQNERIDAAERKVEELVEVCPDGCGGDLPPLLAGIYWAATDVRPELQDRIVEAMVELGEARRDRSLAVARMFQGWTFMRDDDFDQSLIAFLEAQRLFEDQENSPYGAARAQFYISLSQLMRGEQQEAFEAGMQAREYMAEVGDFRSVARIYERLAELYADLDSGPPREFMLAGSEILQSGLQAWLATGDYGTAAQMGFSYGNFLFRAGNVDHARMNLQQAVTRALRVAEFETVAMGHLFLALLARAQGNRQLFEEEMDRARLMAEIADETYIRELIEEVEQPSEDRRPDDDPTDLL